MATGIYGVIGNEGNVSLVGVIGWSIIFGFPKLNSFMFFYRVGVAVSHPSILSILSHRTGDVISSEDNGLRI